MGKMDRYRRYLLKVNEAHELHTTEYQKNQPYRSFIIKATTNTAFQKLHFENLLDEPWKRITAYVVLLEDIRNYTPVDHPDFAKLTDAFTQINTIASVRDDLPTMLATKSHDLYLSIRKAPVGTSTTHTHTLDNENNSILFFGGVGLLSSVTLSIKVAHWSHIWTLSRSMESQARSLGMLLCFYFVTRSWWQVDPLTPKVPIFVTMAHPLAPLR